MSLVPGTGTVSPARAPWRRLGLFGLLPILSVASPLLVLPVIARATGPEGWAAVAIGTAVGSAAVALVDVGWVDKGPGMVGRGRSGSPQRVLAASLASRLAVFVPVLAVIVPVSVLLAPDGHELVSALLTVATAAIALLPTWYFVARGAPMRIALYDTLPRVAAAVLAVVPVLVWRSALPFAVLLLVATLGSVAVSAAWELRGHGAELASLGIDTVRALRTGWPLAVSGLVGGAYTSLLVPLFAIGTDHDVLLVAVFAAAVRLMYMAQGGIRACLSAFSGWVAEDWGAGTVHRMRTALLVNGSAGLVTGMVLAVGMPLLSRVVFGPEIVVPWPVGVGVGVAIASFAVSQSIMLHVLAPAERIRPIAVVTAVGSVVGVPLLLVASMLDGIVAAAAVVAVVELLMLALLLPAARATVRGLSEAIPEAVTPPAGAPVPAPSRGAPSAGVSPIPPPVPPVPDVELRPHPSAEEETVR